MSVTYPYGRVLRSSEFVKALLGEAQWERRDVLRRATQGTGLSTLGEMLAHLAGMGVEELCSGARRALAQVAIGELGRSGAAVARHLGVATSTANRVATGALAPLAQPLLTAIQGR